MVLVISLLALLIVATLVHLSEDSYRLLRERVTQALTHFSLLMELTKLHLIPAVQRPPVLRG